MRRVIFSVASSVDGYIANKDRSLDWILSDPEGTAAMATFWSEIDTVIVGRKTYEPVLASGKGWPSYPGVKTYVFSHTLAADADKNVSVIAADPVEFIKQLQTEAGKDIFVMGGGELANSLLAANVIDEIRLNIQPVLLGSGVALFPTMERQVTLELAECRSYQNGRITVRYQVKLD